jgi:hypothetical protein
VAGSCEYSDEPLGSGATELVIYSYKRNGDSLRWIESSLDLLFAMVVLPESVTEELQLII